MTLVNLPARVSAKAETAVAQTLRWHAENKQKAQLNAAAALALGAEFASQCGEVAAMGELLPPGAADRLRRLAEHTEREVQALTFLIKKGSFR